MIAASPALEISLSVIDTILSGREMVSPFKLCLFDLDQTLLRTDDLEIFRGRRFVNHSSEHYTAALINRFDQGANRLIYSEKQILQWRRQYPKMQWGVFTRAPRHYAMVLLRRAYPHSQWNCLIAFEDVKKTKPDPEGIYLAMRQCKVRSAKEVVIVGDSKPDISTAYNAGCWSVLDTSSWVQRSSKIHHPVTALVPDMRIDEPAMLTDCLSNPFSMLPEMEYRMSSHGPVRSDIRLDRLVFQIEHDSLFKDRRLQVTVMGRLFARYESLGERRGWHPLSRQIVDHKGSESFPDSWIQCIRAYLDSTCRTPDPIVTVIPFKPGRKRRLEALLRQVAHSHKCSPIVTDKALTFDPEVLFYTKEALSFHKQYLNFDRRFRNAEISLRVKDPRKVRDRQVIVIDDVVTTGASLYWAYTRLKEAGARIVCNMALTKTISPFEINRS